MAATASPCSATPWALARPRATSPALRPAGSVPVARSMALSVACTARPICSPASARRHHASPVPAPSAPSASSVVSSRARRPSSFAPSASARARATAVAVVTGRRLVRASSARRSETNVRRACTQASGSGPADGRARHTGGATGDEGSVGDPVGAPDAAATGVATLDTVAPKDAARAATASGSVSCPGAARSSEANGSRRHSCGKWSSTSWRRAADVVAPPSLWYRATTKWSRARVMPTYSSLSSSKASSSFSRAPAVS